VEKIGGLSIVGTAALMLILAPIAIEGWTWVYSAIGMIALGFIVAAWRARDRFL